MELWKHLIQILQGVPTARPIRPIFDAIFASERHYNDRAVIDFFNENLRATGLRTLKRSLDYPFAFGQGPIQKEHMGIGVSGKGCRGIYRAMRQPKTLQGDLLKPQSTGKAIMGVLRLCTTTMNNSLHLHESR